MDDGRLRIAIVNRLSRQIGRSIEPGEVDYSASFLDGPVGGHTLDSLGLVELVTTLEEELDAPILDAEEIEDVDTLDKLARHIGATATADRVASFVQQWA